MNIAIPIGLCLVVVAWVLVLVIAFQHQGETQTVSCPSGYTLTVQRLSNGDLEYGCVSN